MKYISLVRCFVTCAVCLPFSMDGNTLKDLQMNSGLKVIKLEYILRLKIKRNDWLIADMCPQAANHCALF